MIHILSAQEKNCIGDNRKGFTLVDILVGLAMASVLMVAMVSLFTTMGRSYTTQNVAADVQQVARAGVELMIQEMRMAGFDPSGSAGAAIFSNFDDTSVFDDDHKDKVPDTDATHIAFTIDADMDGRIDHCRSDEGTIKCPAKDDNIGNELIAYRINNGVLEKYKGGSAYWEELTENNVSGFSFTYYDGNGDETTAVDAIRTVEISMTVQLPAGRRGTLSRTYSTRVRCRNIGL